MLAGLAEGTTRLSNFSTGADPHSTLGCIEALGATVTHTGEGRSSVIEVTGTAGAFQQPAGPLDCGNSGSTMRMLSGLIAPHPHTFTLIGDHSLTLRPMERIRKPLSQMGAKIDLDRRPRPHHHPRRPAPGHRLRHAHPQRAGQDRRPLRRPPGRRAPPASANPSAPATTPSTPSAPSEPRSTAAPAARQRHLHRRRPEAQGHRRHRPRRPLLGRLLPLRRPALPRLQPRPRLARHEPHARRAARRPHRCSAPSSASSPSKNTTAS